MKVQYTPTLKDFIVLCKAMNLYKYCIKELLKSCIILFIFLFSLKLLYLIKIHNVLNIICFILYSGYFVYLIKKYNIFSLFSIIIQNNPITVEFKNKYLLYQSEPIILTQVYYKDITVYNQKESLILQFGQTYLSIPKRAFNTHKELQQALSLLKNKG